MKTTLSNDDDDDNDKLSVYARLELARPVNERFARARRTSNKCNNSRIFAPEKRRKSSGLTAKKEGRVRVNHASPKREDGRDPSFEKWNERAISQPGFTYALSPLRRSGRSTLKVFVFITTWRSKNGGEKLPSRKPFL